MRESFQAELDRLVDDLARMARLAARMMTNATDALHQADLALAELVISTDDEMNVLHDDVELRCVSLLALQAPVAADLRVVVSAMH
ncbi:MAG: phosphate transport system regulatory protein PhoU, partial [Actinomycetota bacterium]|nr:phosphate transport system regulatory protein PhoU [Actinomycetota bacterium]